MTYDDAASRCWLEVDLTALRQNYRAARAMVSEGVQVIPVLKANAYGMGAVQVARTLSGEGARLFAVASSDEAEQLLRNVDNIEVLTLGRVGDGAAARLIERGMPLTLYSKFQGRALREIAARLGRPARVHVKIDTGLHRLGFDPDGAAQTVADLCAGGCIQPVGLFTHLAIHTPESDHRQAEVLRRVQGELAARGVEIPFVHAADSIGMARYPDLNMSAVRIGAWLYGVTPRGAATPSRTVGRFCARVSQVRHVKSGELIGYDDDSPLQRDSVVASVSAGYIDGTPRRGSGWQAEVRGRRADVLGIACMDQLMLDVTDIPDVSEGDVVTFVGGGISVEEYARMGALNHNEAWARIGRRVPRIYYEEGRIVRVCTEL